MGSSFSVLNDTNEVIYVSHGVCKSALFGSIGSVLALVTFGAGGASIAAGAGVGGGVILGLSASAWNAIGTVSALLLGASGILNSSLSPAEKEKVKSLKKYMQDNYTEVKPGNKYTAHGSLSLVMTAYVIYENWQMTTCNCFTGPTDGSENVYKVTEYFWDFEKITIWKNK